VVLQVVRVTRGSVVRGWLASVTVGAVVSEQVAGPAVEGLADALLPNSFGLPRDVLAVVLMLGFALHINGSGFTSRQSAEQDCLSAIAFALEGNPADYDPTAEAVALDVTVAPAARFPICSL
jgi:hypothetical protein